MANIVFDDEPLPPGTVVFENAVPKEVPPTISNAGPNPQPNVDEPFLDYKPIKGASVEGAVAAKETAHQEKLANISKALGGNFDPSGELPDKALRFDMGRSDKFSERKAKFQDKYKDKFPNLQYKTVDLADGSSVDIYRFGRDEPFKPVQNLNTTSYGDVAQGAGAVINEQTGLALATLPLTRGMGLSGRLISTPIAMYSGGRLESHVEGVRGYEHTPYGELNKNLLIDAGLAAATEFLTPGSGLISTIRESATKPMPSAGRLVTAAEREGLEPLTVGQISNSPVTRAAFQQAGGTSPRVADVVAKQRTSVHTSLQRLADDKGVDALSDVQLAKLVKEQENELDRIIRNPRMSKSEAGQDLQVAVNQWDDRNRTARDALYERAKRIGHNVEFDLTDLKERAAALRRGYLGTPAEGVENPVQLNPMGKQISQVVDVIDRLNPVMGSFTHEGVTYNPIQQMIHMRDELYGIMRFSPNPAERRQASELWTATKDAMEDPMGGDRRFIYNYNRAKDAHTDRENMLDKAYIKAALDKAEPGQLPSMILKPGNEQTITHLKEIAGEESWNKIKDFKKTELLNDPASIGKMFEDFKDDPKALNSFFSKDEQSILSAYHGRWKETQTPTVQAVMKDRKSLGERAIQLATQAQDGELRNIVELGDKAGVDIKTALRAGVYQSILDDASTVSAEAGGRLIDPQKVITKIESLRKKPALNQFMRPEDWDRLTDFQLYSDVLTQGIDTGGSMQRGAIVGKITSLTSPLKQASALRRITENDIIANILADPVTADKLASARAATTSTTGTSRLANTFALLARRLSRGEGTLPTAVVAGQNLYQQEQ